MEKTHTNDTKRTRRLLGDGYYWYRDSRDADWQPIELVGEKIRFIGKTRSAHIDDLPGTFVKAGKPIPVLSSIAGLAKLGDPLQVHQ